MSGLLSSSRPDLVAVRSERMRTSPWDTYTPSFSATGGGFALNNGTLVGGFRREGTTLYLRGQLAIGSSTAAGTGVWIIGLPAGATTVSSQTQAGSASVNDASGNRYHCGLAIGAGGTTFVLDVASGGLVGPGVPITYATGDTVSWAATLELAP